MSKTSASPLPPGGQFILYQTEDGRTRIQCRFENESIWLSQALIAELFQKDVRTINEHLVNIFEEGELHREATIRKFRIVRQEAIIEDAALEWFGEIGYALGHGLHGVGTTNNLARSAA